MIRIQSRHERSYNVQGNDSSTRKRHHKSLINKTSLTGCMLVENCYM